MRYTVEGLDCANCAAKIEQELHKIQGLEEVTINFATKSLELRPDKMEIAQEVINRVEPGVKLVLTSDYAPGKKGLGRLPAIIVPGVLFLFGSIFNERLHNTAFSWAEYIVLIPAYFWAGWRVIRNAISKIVRGQLFDENFLMMIATIGAILIHQLSEAVGVMLFYSVGEYFQELAVNRSRRSIKALLDIQPDYANLYKNGTTIKIAPENVHVGQIIKVKPGEKIPLDGEVLEGNSFVDTSALTGESVPRKVESGGEVLAGMINGQGLLTIKVLKPFTESSITRILELVEKAAERKAPVEQFITIFARYYTPLVVGLATLIAFLPPLFIPGATLSEWVYRALVLLVISCPCALMISIPLGYFGGIGAASRNGILIKGANFLDALSQLHTVVFDKTGTLTKGVFKVTEIVPKNGFSEEDLLSTVAEAEMHSNHPIARSIMEAYERIPSKGSSDRVTDYKEIPGHGICAIVDGHQVLAGNDRLMHKEDIEHEDCDLEGTSIYIAIDRRYAGYIIISDEIKNNSQAAIEQLKSLGVKNITMLTGDEDSVARRITEKLRLSNYYAELLPEDKVAKLEQLEKNIYNENSDLSRLPLVYKNREKLAFVGDGINDAPVITRADIGVAMGGLGRDAAMEAADIVLMEDDPLKLVKAINIAHSTRRIVKQNIYLALGVKLFFIFLGSMGMANIWEAVFADVGVTVLAVINASRTIRRT